MLGIAIVSVRFLLFQNQLLLSTGLPLKVVHGIIGKSVYYTKRRYCSIPVSVKHKPHADELSISIGWGGVTLDIKGLHVVTATTSGWL